MEPISIFVLAAYGSLLVELLFFALPSEASTYQLFFRTESDGAAAAAPDLERARRRSGVAKLLLYLLPTGIGIVLFLIPPGAVFHPPLLGYLLPIPALDTTAFMLLGVLLVSAGRWITFASVLQLRRMQSSPCSEPRGLFRHSRNPGLVGMYAFYLGNAFLFPCGVLFAGFLPYFINMHRRVLLEESHLSGSLGGPYRAYHERVPRYLFGGQGR